MHRNPHFYFFLIFVIWCIFLPYKTIQDNYGQVSPGNFSGKHGNPVFSEVPLEAIDN